MLVSHFSGSPCRALAMACILFGVSWGVPARAQVDLSHSATVGSQQPPSKEHQAPLPFPERAPSNPLPPKLRQELLKSNFEKTKQDAAELVQLAKELQKDLDKSNENVLSLKVVESAGKIEKLAKKIKNTAKGF